MRGLWLSGVKCDFDGVISKALNSSIMESVHNKGNNSSILRM